MAAKEPTNYQFAGTGLGLEYVGKDHCYAFSGPITTVGTGSANTTALNFTTGDSYIVGTINAQNDSTGDVTSFMSVTLNGSSVISIRFDAASVSAISMDFPLPIIIPPYTVVEMKVGINSGSNIWTTQLVGRVYEHLPVRN